MSSRLTKRININNGGIDVSSIETSSPSLVSLSNSGSPFPSRWISHQLALSLLNEIFGYLNGTDRLVRIERTCRYWSNHSKNGIGWYHLNLNEWKDQRQSQFSYPWPVVYALLTKRLSPRSLHNHSNYSNNGIRSVRGNMTIFHWVDIINQLPRLQYAAITIQLPDYTIKTNEFFTTMTKSLTSSKWISLSLAIEPLSMMMNQHHWHR
jgi:hypothetical protein